MQTTAKRYCARGESCKAFPQLGEPAKLSAHNRASICFKCEESRIAAQLASSAPTRERKAARERPRAAPRRKAGNKRS
jgi:hypothetical protein